MLELSGTFLRGADGTSRGKIFSSGMTRLEKLEEMLKRNEKISAMAELAANFAHEIRTGSMELFCSMLLKDLKSERDSTGSSVSSSGRCGGANRVKDY